MSSPKGVTIRGTGKRDKNRFSRKKRRGAVGSRLVKTTILIVCQGKETEKNYFKDFKRALKARTVHVKVEDSTGIDPNSLVRKTIRFQEKEDYDHVWCVFDKDDFEVNEAFDLAKTNRIEIAFSNECFELWYVLHFKCIESSLGRKQLEGEVTKLFQKYVPDDYPKRGKGTKGRKYNKNDEGIYGLLLDRQQQAIRNAKRLAKTNCRSEPCNNPGTTVYKLVEELNKLIPPQS